VADRHPDPHHHPGSVVLALRHSHKEFGPIACRAVGPFYWEIVMSATPAERDAMLGLPDCSCGTKMQFVSMQPDEDGVTEYWYFRCPECGAPRSVTRKRE
jgi:hypothetical protein